MLCAVLLVLLIEAQFLPNGFGQPILVEHGSHSDLIVGLARLRLHLAHSASLKHVISLHNNHATRRTMILSLLIPQSAWGDIAADI
jgi:hypothetical protein